MRADTYTACGGIATGKSKLCLGGHKQNSLPGKSPGTTLSDHARPVVSLRFGLQGHFAWVSGIWTPPQ